MSQDPIPLAGELRRTVEMLAGRIGERNCYRPAAYAQAADWVESELAQTGLTVRRLPVTVPGGNPFHCPPATVWNLEAVKPGREKPGEVIVVGAHYDSKVATPGWHDHGPPLPDRPGTPAANDNASGVAAVLALAKALAGVPTRRTIRFVAFANEEPPFYQTGAMGSLVYARACAADPAVRIIGMFTPETIGCYSPRPRTKRMRAASLLGLPDRHDYVAFLTHWGAWSFTRACARLYAGQATVPVRVAALPRISNKVAWSDDWSFWQTGVPAFAVTDTAFLRHDDYHELTDTPDTLDYPAMAEVVRGLRHMLVALADS